MNKVALHTAKFASVGDMLIVQALEEGLQNRGYLVERDPLQCNYAILGGGGLLHDLEKFSLKEFEGQSYPLSIYTMRRAMSQGAKFYVMGTGYQGIFCRQNDWRELLLEAEVVSTRDKGSLDALQNDLGIQLKNTEVHGDMCFLEYNEEMNFREPIYDKTLVLSIKTDQPKEVLEYTKGLIDSLMGKSFSLIWAPHEDVDFKNYVEYWQPKYGGQVIGTVHDGVFLPEPKRYISALRMSSGSITHRLHGLLMAIMAGRPVLSLSNDAKVGYQMERLFGQEGYEYQLSGSTAKEGFGLITKMLEDDKIYDRFNSIAKGEKVETQKHFNILK